MNLLSERVASGRQFVVTDYVEAGDQVSVTLSISGDGVPDDGISVTKFFSFRPGTNIVVEMKDGVDILALRALHDQRED